MDALLEQLQMVRTFVTPLWRKPGRIPDIKLVARWAWMHLHAHAYHEVLTTRNDSVVEHANKHAPKSATGAHKKTSAGSITSKRIKHGIFTLCRYHELHFWGHMCDESFVPSTSVCFGQMFPSAGGVDFGLSRSGLFA